MTTLCAGQEGPELDLQIESPYKKVRGGEKILYSCTVTNRKDVTVKTVILAHDFPEEVTFLSASVSRGSFRLVDSGMRSGGKRVLAEFGDIEGFATATLTVEAKTKDWGDRSIPVGGPRFDSALRIYADSVERAARVPLPSSGGQPEQGTAPDTGEWALPLTIRIFAVSHGEGYYVDSRKMPSLTVEFLQSANIPPRIEILTPTPEQVFIKPAAKEIEVPIKFKVFDPDGNIAKVVIGDNSNLQHGLKLEDGVYKYVIGGKTYTQSELEERSEDEEFLKITELRLAPTEGDVYVYTVKRFSYHNNSIRISVTDDGGRVAYADVEIKVKSDSKIEILKPTADVFLPGSIVTVETISRVGGGVRPKVTLGGTKGYWEAQDPEMQLVSHSGNTYIHRFTWKVGKEGLYDLEAKLLENGEDTQVSDWMRTVAAQPRTLRITSLRNGQIFNRGERITVSTRGTDIGGKVIYDKLELIVDGKLNGEIPISQKHGPPPAYNVISTGYADRYILDLQPGPHTVQVIARHEFGTKLGASELVKIIVK